MSNAGAPESSAVKRALVEVRDLRARLERHERARSEAIAITGVGVRLPGGVATCDQYWDLLREGRDAISEVPRDRWDVDGFHDPDPDAPGRIATRYGGFLDQVDAFDPRFFGITPREAVSMDPQQRLLLEVAWEALEHAGQAPDQLAGQPVGVFVGLSSTDYLTTELKFGAEAEIDAYLATGGHPSVASGRLSYVLGLQGPALTVDTACSSSLAAIHLAVQSLRGGECRMALAGGVNLMLMPELSVNFSRARMMAPDGRCKTFDRRADGYVRSEGCGVVVLKRLSDAVADGDRVLAVVRGTALNQDGRSSGLTVPNGPAQEAVIRDALRRAGVRPADVDYVEAHGTGTALGDPVELRALGQVFRDGRTTGPLAVGSVKTNLGHLEAAAGVAGLIKVVLALQHETIPQHLHLQEPTPHVDWARLSLSVPTSPTPWRRSERPRLAGVSAFGFSGTNAHVVVGEAPDAPPAAVAGRDRPWHLLAVSGKTVPALRTAAARLSDHLATTRDPLADICHTAAAGRAHFAERAALVVRSIDEARGALDALAAGREHHAIVTGPTLDARRPEVAFLFAGQGTQYAGMGRGLFESQPVFRRTLQACEEILRPHLEQPLLEVLYPPVGRQSPIDETAYAQPVLFAFEYALAEMWRSWGVDPTMVLGHSLGEDVAACVAGVFPLEDGLRMVAERARVMEAGLETGAMAAVFAPEERVRAYLAGGSPSIEIAALNGPHHVVVSGPSADVARLVARIESDAIKVRPLTTARACHSALMDPVLDELEQLAARMSFSAPHLGLVSTLTGRLASATEVTDPRYWRRHVREAVRYTDALQTLCDEGIRLFVEIGPNGTLTGMARRGSQGATGLWLPSLKRDDDWQQVLATLGALHARGVPVNWSVFDAGYGRRKVTLPPSPFERSRYWSDAVRPRVPETPGAPAGAFDRDAILARCGAQSSGEAFYAQLVERGHLAGPRSRAVRQLFTGAGEALAELEVPAGAAAGNDAWRLDPALADACADLAAWLCGDAGGWTAASFAKMEMRQSFVPRAWCHARRRTGADGVSPLVDVVLADDQGGLVARIDGLAFARTGSDGAEWASGWIHEVRWRPQPRAVTPASQPAARQQPAGTPAAVGRWVVLADAGGVGRALAGSLRANGFEARVVGRAGTGGDQPADVRISPGEAHAFDAVVAGGDVPLLGCVNLWSLDADDRADAIDDGVGAGVLGTLHLAQALARTSSAVPVWTVTGSAVAVDADRPRHPAQATAWGLSRVIGLEHPGLRGGLIDADIDDPGVAASEILAELLAGGDEDQVVLKGERRFVPRLVASGRVATTPVPLDSAGTYLITGGLGRLGLDLARWMAEKGARHLTLVSRSGLPDRHRWDAVPSGERAAGGIAAVRAIEALGAQVTVVAADVADPDRMAEVFAAFGRSAPPLRGVVHAATEAGATRIAELTESRLRAMLRSKVTGTAVLHRLAAAHGLDFFVLFSSIAGVLGSAMLGHYGAANAFLDAFAQAHRSDACPVTSVAWGPWERLDLSAGDLRRATEGGGFGKMPLRRALEAFGHLLHPRPSTIVVVDADWPAVKSVYEAKRRRPMLDELGLPRPASVTTGPASADARTGEARIRIESARAADRVSLLTDHVLHEAARVLRIDPETLDPGHGLFDLGMDSLMSAELKARLESSLALTVPATLAFNYPSVAAIAGFLASRLFEPDTAEEPPAAPVAGSARPSDSSPAAVSLDALSEDELAVLLAGRLAEL